MPVVSTDRWTYLSSGSFDKVSLFTKEDGKERGGVRFEKTPHC
jgi:hypothetical protein